MRALAVAVVCWLTALGVAYAQSQPLLSYGVTGSVTSEDFGNPTTLLAREDVQRLVLRAAHENGVTAADATMMLNGVTLEQVIAGGLLRTDGGRYGIAFNLITAADRAHIDAVLAPYAQSLANALLGRRARFEYLMTGYALPGVSQRDVAFALIGCVALDWDGLAITAERGYRAPAVQHANGDHYIVWAHENGPDVSYRALYWGSHNDQRGASWLTTFGDHDALPRAGLPDAVWEARAAILRAHLPEEAREALRLSVYDDYEATLDRAAAAMLALRDGPRSAASLAQAMNTAPALAHRTMDLLAALHYVRREGGAYRAAVPVFAERDRAMLNAVRAEARTIVSHWLRNNDAQMRRDLGELSAVRAGVPYEQVFTEVWHYLFGAANARLAASGFIADPYEEGAQWRGFVPFVWASSLALTD